MEFVPSNSASSSRPPPPLLPVQSHVVMVEHLPGEELGLGVGFDEELGHVVITYISDGSAADRCGQLQVLDPLVSINGQTVDRTSDFRAILSASSAGDPVELKI